MSEISFGLGKTYDFSSTYWSTRTNVQSTNTSTATAEDGWMVLAFKAATDTVAWADTTGWAISNATTEISPAGQLHQVRAANGYTAISNAGATLFNGGVGCNAFSLFKKVKIDVPGVYAAADGNTSGARMDFEDGTRTHFLNIRSDGTNFHGWSLGGGVNWVDEGSLGAAVDTRWHLIGLYNNNTADQDVVVLDGKEALTGFDTYDASGGTAGKVYFYDFMQAGDGNTELHQDFVKFFNSITPWETTDGVLESDATHAIFDAGAGQRWYKSIGSYESGGAGAVLALHARTASTAAGLAAATYFEVTDTVPFAVGNRGRFIQIRFTFSDGGSGQATPILKNTTFYTEGVLSEASYDSILVKGQLVPGTFVGKDGDSKSQEGQTDSYGNLVIKCY